jgi:putative hydrolase of the HAD superfamily
VIVLAVKAVLFDLGNTLVKFDVDGAEEVFHRILTSIGISRSLDEIRSAHSRTEKQASKNGLIDLFGQIKPEDYWSKWDSLVLEYLNIPNHVILAGVVHSKWFDFLNFSTFPEVEDVLSKLREKGLKLGLISNGYEEEIDLILKRVDLSREFFEIIAGVDTWKRAKPNLEIFNNSLRELKVSPKEALYVGDNPDIDIEPAQKIGLKAILIKRKKDNVEKNPERWTISNLKEILKFLE